MQYDIIGDIHGCYKTLIALLEKLGYSPIDGVYQHPSRQVIFLGDFIDRGPYQCDVIDIVRPMVDAEAALAVMGNHEFNAIAYYTPDTNTGNYLREHSEKNQRQHHAFLAAYEDQPSEYKSVINWFKTLPLWLDLGELKIIHACWDKKLIERIQTEQGGNTLLSDQLLHKASRKGEWQYEAIETLLKGKEIKLNDGASFKDKDGNVRHHIRVRWWDQTATTYKAAFLGPEKARTHIPDDEIEGEHLVDYSHHEPPVFLGHYWLEGDPAPLAENITCLDYSVAKPGGKLVAYRWEGEQKINKDHFVWVDRLES